VELSANASAYKNNALFEIPEFLEEILTRSEHRIAGLGSPVSKRNMLERVAWSSLASRLEASYPT
jgi:hypothetical protein